MPLLQQGIVEHWERLFESAGDCITYTRDTESVELNAIKGSSNSILELPDGVVRTIRADDWILLVDDFYLAGVMSKPKLHDRITWTDQFDVDHKYDVSLDGSERQWDFLDQHETLMRVHTTEMKA